MEGLSKQTQWRRKNVHENKELLGGGVEVKYKSKLKRNSKYNPHSKRFINRAMLSNPVSIEKCEDKMAYQTINKARQAKKKIEKGGAVMEIYKCPHCKKFHLTSIERSK